MAEIDFDFFLKFFFRAFYSISIHPHPETEPKSNIQLYRRSRIEFKIYAVRHFQRGLSEIK